MQLRIGADGEPDVAAYAQHTYAESCAWSKVEKEEGPHGPAPVVYPESGTDRLELRMSLSKVGMVLLAMGAFSAFAASSALAANEYEESGGAWYTGATPGTKLPDGEANAKSVSTEIASEKLALNGTVGGETLELKATGVNCIECEIYNSTFREGPPLETSATATTKLSLTGLTLTSPQLTKCSVASTLATQKLHLTLGKKKSSTTIGTLKFVPLSGATIATVEILGASCPSAGLYKLTGTFFSEEANATGVFAKSQKMKFSKAIQESAGTSTSLKLGENGAFLTGEVNKLAQVEYAGKEN